MHSATTAVLVVPAAASHRMHTAAAAERGTSTGFPIAEEEST